MSSLVKIENATSIIATVTGACVIVGLFSLMGYVHPVGYNLLSWVTYREVLISAFQALVTLGALYCIGAAASQARNASAWLWRDVGADTAPSEGMDIAAPPVGTKSRFFTIMLHLLRHFPEYLFLYLCVGALVYLVSPKSTLFITGVIYLGPIALVAGLAAMATKNRTGATIVMAFAVCCLAFLNGEQDFYRDAFHDRRSLTLQRPFEGRSEYIFLRRLGEYLLVLDGSTNLVRMIDNRQEAIITLGRKVCDEPEWKKRMRQSRMFDPAAECNTRVTLPW